MTTLAIEETAVDLHAMRRLFVLLSLLGITLVAWLNLAIDAVRSRFI